MLRPQNADDRNQGCKDKLFTDWKNIVSMPSSPLICLLFNEMRVKTEKFCIYKLILKFTWKSKSNTSQNQLRKGNTKLEELEHWIKTYYKFWSLWSLSRSRPWAHANVLPQQRCQGNSGKWISSMKCATIRHPSMFSNTNKRQTPVV